MTDEEIRFKCVEIANSRYNSSGDISYSITEILQYAEKIYNYIKWHNTKLDSTKRIDYPIG